MADGAPTDATSDEGGVPGWVWWLLAAAVAAAAALTGLLVVRSRRRAQREALASAESEVVWLTRELLPQLRGTGSLEQVAGGWRVALPRVGAAEDQLTVLESSAKEPADRVRARALRDAVRDARARVEAATSRGAEGLWALDLDEAIARLESALAAEQTGRG